MTVTAREKNDVRIINANMARFMLNHHNEEDRALARSGLFLAAGKDAISSDPSGFFSKVPQAAFDDAYQRIRTIFAKLRQHAKQVGMKLLTPEVAHMDGEYRMIMGCDVSETSLSKAVFLRDIMRDHGLNANLVPTSEPYANLTIAVNPKNPQLDMLSTLEAIAATDIVADINARVVLKETAAERIAKERAAAAASVAQR